MSFDILPLRLKSYLKNPPLCLPALYSARQFTNTTVKELSIQIVDEIKCKLDVMSQE